MPYETLLRVFPKQFMDALYREEILIHARNPKYRGVLEHPDIIASLTNTTCGDEITLYANVNCQMSTHSTSSGLILNEVEGLNVKCRIEEVTFEGRGCIISQAAADLFLEHITGKTIDEIATMRPGDMLALLGSAVGESRKPCALLAYEAMQRELVKHVT